MNLDGNVAIVTGGASGLGLATTEALAASGATVVIADLPASDGEEVASRMGGVVRFHPTDITRTADVEAACDVAGTLGEFRALVHCAGRGGPVRVVDRDGAPGSLEAFEAIVRTNLVGSFNVLRCAAARMARLESVDGERGVCVLTASVAAFEGQIGQLGYASSKAGVVGLTLVAARDLASKQIRVCTIAPGTFDTPMLAKLSADMKDNLAKAIPHPRRLGRPEEYGALARHIIENPMLNGETIRLDGAIRMPPR